MKTERRHELQKNELADSLAHWIAAAKPYSRAGLALLVAAVVLIFTWGYLSTQNTRRESEGWAQYFEAFNTRDPRDPLSEIAKQYAGTTAGEWARAVLADIQLDDGTNRLFTDKKIGRDELRQAVETYQSILADSRQPSMLQRATFGLARAHEALGTLDKARDEYRSIAKQWPTSPYVESAEKRAKDLDQVETKEFYDWFAKYEPPRPMSKEPGTPGARPDFMNSLDSDGVKLPSNSADKAPLGAATANTPSSEPPADAATEASDDQPAAADKPAEPEAAAPSEPAPESK